MSEIREIDGRDHEVTVLACGCEIRRCLCGCHENTGLVECAKHGATEDLLAALKHQMPWTMRDGSPCNCPAGRAEEEQCGVMPEFHSSMCEEARVAIAKAGAK